jgi:hypothetical protein
MSFALGSVARCDLDLEPAQEPPEAEQASLDLTADADGGRLVRDAAFR